MYKYIILSIIALSATQGFGQAFETVNVKSISAYENKSYKYKGEVKFLPGFSVSAQSSGGFFCSPLYNQPPSLDKNFVRTETVLIPGVLTEPQVAGLPITQKTTTYQFVDGLARNSQAVSVGGSPLQNDVIQPIAYDQYGRLVFGYLPFISTGTGGGQFIEDAVNKQNQFYNGPPSTVLPDSRPWSESVFEASPLNRIITQYGPGIKWKNGTISKGITTYSKLNQASENIIRWKNFISGLPERDGIYPANHLMVRETIDEEGQITKEYKDSRGLVVLRRVGDGTNWFDTQYLYSPSGLLMIVIQPEGVARLANEFDAGGADKQSFLDRWCFLYQYDEEQRLIANRIPGWEPNYWAYTIYDKWNRIVYTQTPAQSERNEWSFIKYDRFNRVIINGLYTYTTSNPDKRQSLQDDVNTFYNQNPNNRYETELSNTTGYSLNSTPPINPAESSITSLSYYDYYTFLTYPNWETDVAISNFNFQNISGYPQYNSSDANASEIFHVVKGQLTGSKTRVLGSTRWLNSVTWYDKKYRPIQVINENYAGGLDRSTSKVDFTGKTEKNLLSHSSATTSMTVLREFVYDHVGRLLKTYQTTDGGTKVLMASNTYNELGQLVEKNIHSTDEGLSFLQSVDMRYNIRGWLTNINNSTLTNDGVLNDDASDLFGMELLYNPASPPVVNGYTTPKLYNGNISALKWKISIPEATPEERIFGFEYDVLNRFKKSYYASKNAGAWTGNAGLFDEQVTGYDKNGNINGIVRKGKVNGALATIDNLTHNYVLNGKASNRLISLSDASGNTLGFKDAAAQLSEEYLYDRSGNLNYDHNKQISGITYNHLNLPTVIEFTRPNSTQDRIEYTYDASGIKLRTVIKINGTQVWKTDYVGSIQYDNDQLSFAATPEGRVIKNSTGFDYEYFYKDHQGNVRLTYGQFKETVSYRATMENPPPPSTLGSNEEATFKNIASTRYTNGPGENFNYTPSSEQVLTPDKSSRTNAFTGKIIGPAKSLQLAAGDKVKMEVMARYTQVTGSTATVAFSTLVSALATTTFGFSSGETGFNSFNSNAGGIPGLPGASSTLPKAYLAYLFFDLNYEFVPSGSGAVSISTSAYNAFEKLERTFTAAQPGYLYIYVANESNTSTSNVYWDEMLIVHQKNNSSLQVTQASDYYPFGLAFNTFQTQRISDNYKGVQKNRYGFQGQEWQSDLGIDWSQFKWRMHDPAIGRFGAVDPLSDKYLYNSTYAFSENRLLDGIELEGLEYLNANYFWSKAGNEKFFGRTWSDWQHHASQSELIKLFGEFALTWATNIGLSYTAIETGGVGLNTLKGEGKSLIGNTFKSSTLKNSVGQTTKLLDNGLKQLAEQIDIYGGALKSADGRTTTLLGSNRPGSGLSEIKSRLNIKQGKNEGAFNILDERVNLDWSNPSHREYFWEMIDKPWMDDAIRRGDKFRIVDDPYDLSNIYYRGDPKNGFSFFGRELDYLKQQGYTLSNGYAVPK